MIDLETLIEIVDRIEAGERVLTAVRACGLSPRLHFAEMYANPEYRRAIERAEASANARLERAVFEGCLNDPRIAQAELSRRDPEQHSERLMTALAEARLKEEGKRKIPDMREVRAAIEARKVEIKEKGALAS